MEKRMPKGAIIGLAVGAASLTLIAGVALGLRFGYSQFAAVSFGLLPAMLFLFPVMRERSGGKLTFGRWLATVFLIALFAAVFNNIIMRFT